MGFINPERAGRALDPEIRAAAILAQYYCVRCPVLAQCLGYAQDQAATGRSLDLNGQILGGLLWGGGYGKPRPINLMTIDLTASVAV